jgi:hypothetical protein
MPKIYTNKINWKHHQKSFYSNTNKEMIIDDNVSDKRHFQTYIGDEDKDWKRQEEYNDGNGDGSALASVILHTLKNWQVITRI